MVEWAVEFELIELSVFTQYSVDDFNFDCQWFTSKCMLKSQFNRNEDKTNQATIELKSNFDLKLHSSRTERPRPIQTHLYMPREGYIS